MSIRAPSFKHARGTPKLKPAGLQPRPGKAGWSLIGQCSPGLADASLQLAHGHILLANELLAPVTPIAYYLVKLAVEAFDYQLHGGSCGPGTAHLLLTCAPGTGLIRIRSPQDKTATTQFLPTRHWPVPCTHPPPAEHKGALSFTREDWKSLGTLWCGYNVHPLPLESHSFPKVRDSTYLFKSPPVHAHILMSFCGFE